MSNSQIKGSSRDEQRKNREVAVDKVTGGKSTNKKGRAAKNEGRNDPVIGDISSNTRQETK